ncbi:putative E3 ubiquitin-protein ligase RING1a isoform X2 [Cornus florida]|uniref:putative E3 ubiquitin-protein ligase RING1a isoform X2 n=1 Tax=Cornus florida TaxID=4283 RepID=UPI00289A05EB|nr:putative E3 ubiquitin-protein ligase RING1a isoform X2 [Cornus florida]
MPAQKRSSSENLHDEESLQQHFRRKQSRREREDEDEEEEEQDDEEGEEDSDGSRSCDDPEKTPEIISVVLPDVRRDVQCPICLGIIKKTRTVMECMHRFCRECIDKSMRLGNNECPACRTHCASRRSLRDDPRYDTIIESIYPDIDKYEEEELAFHDEERARNKQIQASIAQIFQRQSEALVKRRTTGKDTAAASTARLRRNYRNAYTRRRRNSRVTELLGSDDNEEENDHDGNKDSSSTEEHGIETKQRRGRRRTGARLSQPSPSVANSDGKCIENDLETGRESTGISPGIIWNPEMLAWGRGGTRSHARHGSANSSKCVRSTRLSKLVEYLRSLEENDNELDVQLMLISLDKQRTPSLQQPYLCCRPSLSIKHLCEYIAHETPLQADDVELLVVKETPKSNVEQSTLSPPTLTDNMNSFSQMNDPCKVGLQILEEPETLAAVRANSSSSQGHLILAYRQKETN